MEMDAIQHQKEGCGVRKLNTHVVLYKRATRKLWTGNRAHFYRLAVKEGASVERNNVRMS